MKYTITIPLTPPSANSNESKRWSYAKIKPAWTEAVWAECKSQNVILHDRISVDIVIYYKTNRRRDWENSWLATKFVHDGLVVAGVIPDDNIKHIKRPLYPDIKVDPKNPRTVITIKPV